MITGWKLSQGEHGNPSVQQIHADNPHGTGWVIFKRGGIDTRIGSNHYTDYVEARSIEGHLCSYLYSASTGWVLGAN